MHSMRLLITLLCLALCGLNLEATNPPETSVQQKFVPVKSTDGNGAIFSELHQFPTNDSKTLAVQANAGIGDQFPVQEKGQPALFEVFVADGDNDHLMLEIRTKGDPQKIELKRDKSVEVQIDGIKYRFLFPTVSVSSAAKATTTNQAFIIVGRDR